MAKLVFVTGGVVSSLGKGITAASLGRLLKSRGLKVAIQKLDPYINVDPGTMSPYQHGEVFVTEDGAKPISIWDIMSVYDINISSICNVTTGGIYSAVINKERREITGVWQVILITNEIKEQIRRVANESNADVVISKVAVRSVIESCLFLSHPANEG